MKTYRSYFKANRMLLLSVLIIMLAFDGIIIMSGLENGFNSDFMISMIVFLVITVAVMAFVCILIIRGANKMIPVAELMDEKGMCPEVIDKYRQLNPKMTARNHCVLASYYLSMDELEAAENELVKANGLTLYDVMSKVYYSDLYVSLRMRQRRFADAAVMYNNYDAIAQPFCRSHAGPIAVNHYSHGAVLYALNGNFTAAMDLINLMDKSVKKQRYLAFTRNTSLMAVYLIMGDFANADQIRQRMLTDLETFDEFDMKVYKSLTYKDIETTSQLFDRRLAQADQY